MISGARAGRKRARGVSPAFLLHWTLGEQWVRNGKRCASGTAQGALRAPLSELLLTYGQPDEVKREWKATSTLSRSTLVSVCSSFLVFCPEQSSPTPSTLLCAVRGSGLQPHLELAGPEPSPRQSARRGTHLPVRARTVISEVPLQQRTALYADSAAAAHLHKQVCQALAAQA